MAITLAFDVYGTLINTNGISGLVQTFVGDKAISFIDSWRAKQLEYTFRRGLMKNYVDFSECTRNALDFTCEVLKCHLQPEERNRLMREYKVLPAFADVRESLGKLKSANLCLFAFSNGSAPDVSGLLENAGILHLFEDVVSVDDVKSFKPNPAVYEHFLLKSNSAKANAWLISSNSFDVIGAISYGMNSVWVQRNPDAIFDTWNIQPTRTISSLQELIPVFNI